MQFQTRFLPTNLRIATTVIAAVTTILTQRRLVRAQADIENRRVPNAFKKDISP
jgi:hypothetical protein